MRPRLLIRGLFPRYETLRRLILVPQHRCELLFHCSFRLRVAGHLLGGGRTLKEGIMLGEVLLLVRHLGVTGITSHHVIRLLLQCVCEAASAGFRILLHAPSKISRLPLLKVDAVEPISAACIIQARCLKVILIVIEHGNVHGGAEGRVILLLVDRLTQPLEL